MGIFFHWWDKIISKIYLKVRRFVSVKFWGRDSTIVWKVWKTLVASFIAMKAGVGRALHLDLSGNREFKPELRGVSAQTPPCSRWPTLTEVTVSNITKLPQTATWWGPSVQTHDPKWNIPHLNYKTYQIVSTLIKDVSINFPWPVYYLVIFNIIWNQTMFPRFLLVTSGH